MAIAAGLALTTPALAADQNDGSVGSLTYMQDFAVVDANAAGTLDVHCPTGTHVVGLGLDTESSVAGSVINSLYPTDGSDPDSRPDDNVVARLHLGKYWEGVTVYATCSTTQPKYVVRTRSVPAQSAYTFTAHCGAQNGTPTHVVGGGLASTGSTTAMRLATEYPADDASDGDSTGDNAWRTTVYNRSSSAHDATFFGICSTATSIYPTLIGTAADSTGMTYGFGCNSDHIISGGLNYSGDKSAFALTYSWPYSSDSDSIPDDSWTFGWRAPDADAAANTVDLYTICEPN